MKHIINYLGALLAVVLIGATFTACSEDDKDSANVGLGIKTFFPTKVVTNQPMTINGSGFADVTKIEFPGDIEVTNFEIVSNEMIRVNAPAGISAEGGKIKVETSDGEAESSQSLTIGHTSVTGFSKQPGDEANGGDLIEVYGSDLEFINKIELLDADGETQFVDHKDFYRKGTSQLMFRVPLKNIFEGTFVGYLHTYDGQKIAMPELAYAPNKGGGYWEKVENVIWEGNEDLSDGKQPFIGTDAGAEFIKYNVQPGEMIRFYIEPTEEDWYFEVFEGHWGPKYAKYSGETNPDLKVGEQGYVELELTQEIIDAALIQGWWGGIFVVQGKVKLTKVVVLQEVWHEPEGGGGSDLETTIWGEETVFGDWSATIAIPADKFADVKEGDIIRVYYKDKGSDYNPIFKHVDNWADWSELQSVKAEEDGYFEATVPAAAVSELKEKGLRFQGLGFTVTKVDLILKGAGGGGGDSGSGAIWEEETVFDSWSATIVIPAEKFATAKAGNMVRVTIKDKGDDYNPIFKHVDDWSDWSEFQSGKVDGDGYFEAPIPSDALDELNQKGLRFQGVGFTIVKVELLP